MTVDRTPHGLCMWKALPTSKGCSRSYLGREQWSRSGVDVTLQIYANNNQVEY